MSSDFFASRSGQGKLTTRTRTTKAADGKTVGAHAHVRSRVARAIKPRAAGLDSTQRSGGNRGLARSPGKRGRNDAQAERLESRALSGKPAKADPRKPRPREEVVARAGARGAAGARGTREKLRLPLAGARAPAKPPASASTAAGKALNCSACGLCCTYVAIEIDGPTTGKRATEILWYLYHDGVSIYVNDDSWMVQFETTCRFLTADKRCGVYHTRPHICREFSEQECEVNTGDDGHTFYTPDTFMSYVKQTRPRVWAHVMKGYAPPTEAAPETPAFQLRLNAVHQRRAALQQR